MSRIYFHSPSGTAELHGSERHHLGALVSDVTVGLLNVRSPSNEDRLKRLIHPEHYMATTPFRPGGWATSFETALRVGIDGQPLLTWKGRTIEPFDLALNTALAIHAWVDGPNRAWLADIMQVGLDVGMFRTGFWYADAPKGPLDRWSSQGWEGVMTLLRARDDEPVVLSYSVCDSFPNPEVAGWRPPPMPDGWEPGWADTDEGQAEWQRDYPTPEDREAHYRDTADEQWDNLPAGEQWSLGITGLRSHPGRLELRPDDWDDFRFGAGLTVFDLYAHDWQDHLDRALGAIPSDASTT